jgi:hypothetical protein
MTEGVCNNERHGLTREQLVSAEPRLASLLEDVRATRPDDGDEYELEGPSANSNDFDTLAPKRMMRMGDRNKSGRGPG